MLSYSTGESGSGAGVDKVGPQPDSFANGNPDYLSRGRSSTTPPSIRRWPPRPMPNSPVAGRATVLIFPDLTPATTPTRPCSKCRAIAIGPCCRDSTKPVNDLSRRPGRGHQSPVAIRDPGSGE